MKNTTLVAGAILFLASCGSSENTTATDSSLGDTASTELVDTLAPVSNEETSETSAEQQAAANAKINLVALAAYRDHAEQFRLETGNYPLTKRSFRSALGAFQEAAEQIAEAGTEVDLVLPEGAEMGQPGRIVYRSDGSDYKLIAQRTGDCSVVRETNPDLIDPKRDYGPGDCIAYGYWTGGAETW